MDTITPDDDFDNSLAVYLHDIRIILPAAACRLLEYRIRAVHTDQPSLDLGDAVVAALAALDGRPARSV